MFVKIFLLLFTCVMLVEVCENDQVTLRTNALLVRKLQLGAETKFTWQATRGTSDIIIQYKRDIQVDISNPDEATLLVSVDTGLSANANVNSPRISVITSIAVLVTICFLGVKQKMNIIVLVGLSMYFFVCGFAQTNDCGETDSIHILVPSALTQEICQNGKCWPVLCRLSLFSEYSSLPSNNELLFSDQQCNIRKPDHWQEWLEHFFGADTLQDYYGDPDGDGLVNVLEYYGPAAFNNSFLVMDDVNETTTGVQFRVKRQAPTFQFAGTDPTKADSDGDLLQDGFEVANGMDPAVPDGAEDDDDGDNLNNLNEQIHKTDPQNPDSDGDGVLDGDEVSNGGDPRNPADQGRKPPDVQDAMIRLTVGDHSGSHSERYILIVGDISHQSPGYGLVGSGTYTFTTGTYKITMQHAGTILESPDHDYTAQVVKVSGKAKVTIQDPQNILGIHSESNYFYAAGKSATLLVEGDCSNEGKTDQECVCGKLKTCTDCKSNDKCVWMIDDARCSAKGAWNQIQISKFLYKPLPENVCPCDACRAWYQQEKVDTTWLTEVNTQFPCPCKVSINVHGVTPASGTTTLNWIADYACVKYGTPFCALFHPGANGCLRSAETTPSGAGQQCCYGDNGLLLAHEGAGTPDKSASGAAHVEVDVDPFYLCCVFCKETDSCQRYKEVRKGDSTHCNGK